MIYVSLGSNVGHRLEYLQRATLALEERCLKNTRHSIVLETECLLPEGAPASWDQPFLNMVVSGESDLSPQDFLKTLKAIERELGRPEVYERWSPRTIDLDIIEWNGEVVDEADLKIPHPKLSNRPFLLHLLALMEGPNPQKLIHTPEACFLKSLSLFPRFVGIVNVTSDSFSDGGRYHNPDQAAAHALALSEAGASIVELGAQSTRPGAVLQKPEEDYATLEPVLERLKPLMDNGTLKISIDTFWPEVIHKILEVYPVAWINDVAGNLDDATLKRMVDHSCSLCLMHSLEVPPTRDRILPPDRTPISVILEWGQRQIERLMALGFREEAIILDPGIGFGKSAYQNIALLRHLPDLKAWGCPILVGHSRKGYSQAFSHQPPAERDLETLAASSIVAPHADFLRVHNVNAHQRFFVAQHVLGGC